MRDKYPFTVRPARQEPAFTKLLSVSELGKMSPDERMAYESSLKYYRDLNNVTDSARIEGWEEGREAGLSEGRMAEQRLLVGKLHQKGMNVEAIAGLLDIPEAVVREWLGVL